MFEDRLPSAFHCMALQFNILNTNQKVLFIYFKLNYLWKDVHVSIKMLSCESTRYYNRERRWKKLHNLTISGFFLARMMKYTR